MPSNRRYASSVLWSLLLATVACGETDPPPTIASASDTADQILFGLNTFITVDGVKRVRVEADRAYFYESSQTSELFEVTVTFFSPQGIQTSKLTSDEGTYFWRTSNMEARGDVEANTPDGRRLTTSILRYDSSRDEIEGPAFFRFTAPDRTLEGDGFTSDPDFRNVVTSRPRGTLGEVDLERQ